MTYYASVLLVKSPLWIPFLRLAELHQKLDELVTWLVLLLYRFVELIAGSFEYLRNLPDFFVNWIVNTWMLLEKFYICTETTLPLLHSVLSDVISCVIYGVLTAICSLLFTQLFKRRK